MSIGAVHSYDMSIGVDGPGSRFVVFLAGCPLRCLYCHSPDTWQQRNGRPMSVSSVMAEIQRYERFIAVAGGGVTISGGEPLQQHVFTQSLLQACHTRGLHTALDTSGFLGEKANEELLDATDLVLLDIKSFDQATYQQVTQTGHIAPTLRFARRLAERGTPMWIRFVLVPGLTDEPSNINRLADFVGSLRTVERVEVLAFHRLGAHKYANLGLPFPLAEVVPPTGSQVELAREIFRERGLVTY
ncbi:pyruvate formate-lyase-activating protein [Catelliglobosispora koreensis]|uniref:pyruvate formate-lyase-activating protein n=1 Tax=Catelliglobosispora koreensis TaxID=129052 RepID=UPI00036A7358|nr:pyruvate formate-lyase-activating protein [Catelliglobosispora koreensis]